MQTRRLKTWVAIAEIISAIAVVFSLIYVGLEIRRTTIESDTDIQAELLTYTYERRVLVIESEDLSRILIKGYNDLNSLSAEELLRFQYYVELHFVTWERAFMARQAGVFSEELYGGWKNWFTTVAMNNPGFVWPMVRDSQAWPTSFVQEVDESLVSQDRPDP
jgi:hypothetical protein